MVIICQNIKSKVTQTPGEGFDAPGHIRISYATSVEQLREVGVMASVNAAPDDGLEIPNVQGLIGAVLLVGALTFIPALALGPIVEHLQMVARP